MNPKQDPNQDSKQHLHPEPHPYPHAAVAPIRAMLFFSTMLFVLVTVGVSLQQTLGLTGTFLLQILIFVLLPLFFARHVDGLPPRLLFRLRAPALSGVLKAVALGVMTWALAHISSSLILLLVERMGGRLYQPYQELMEAPALIALLAGALLPAFCEEFAFRGYIQGNLSPLGGRWPWIISGLLFGMMHLSLIRLLPLSLLGMVFAYAVLRSGSVWTGVIMHLVNNATVIGLVFLLRWLDLTELGGGMMQETVWQTVLFALVIAVPLTFGIRAIARSFGPGDLLRPEAEAGVGAEAESGPGTGVDLPDDLPRAPGLERVEVARPSAWLSLAALTPALLIYALVVVGELRSVFWPR